MQRTISSFGLVAVAVAALGLLAAACSPVAGGGPAPSAPPVFEERARAIATNALEGLNAGDYRAWSRDWSDTMRAAIGEKDFLAFREQVLASLGRYVSITAIEHSSTKPGTYRWTVTVAFESGTGRIAFGFVEGGEAVEGVFFE